MEFVFQKLERIRTLIGDVDQLRICRQMLGSLQPQQAFASFSLAKLGECFVVRHFVAAVQDLIDQSHHFARVCGDGQHILTNEAAMKTLADLPQVVGQREERGVIEFRGVMQQENGSWTVGDLCEGVLSRGRNDRGVGHVIGIAKPVKGAQIRWSRQLVGKCAAGVSLHEVKRLDQSRGASLISEFCVTEDRLTQIQIRFVCQRHEESPPRENDVGKVLIYIRTCLPHCSLRNTMPKTTKSQPSTKTLTAKRLSIASTAPNLQEFCKSYATFWGKT